MIAQKNPLVLAFVGDAVMTLCVRENLALGEGKVGELHKRASEWVCASAQAVAFDKVSEAFDEVEQDIARRARNVKHNTTPKNAKLADYKKATALEAVIGYHWLMGNHKRIEEILINAN